MARPVSLWTRFLSSRLLQARRFKLLPQAMRLPPKAAFSPRHRCSARSILRSRLEMIAGAAALAIAVGRADATNAGDAPAAREDAAGAIAGRPGAICRHP